MLTWYIRRPEGDDRVFEAASSPGRSTTTAADPVAESDFKFPKGQKASESVREKIAEVTKASQARSEKENLDALEKELARLNALSGEESIDQIAKRFEGWFEMPERKAEPSESSLGGMFDANSAQILDIRREEGEDGTVRYVSIMADSQGRTMEVELDDSNAENTYQTIKRLKANPLAEKLYQQIVMPLFDKMITNPVNSLAPPPPQILQAVPDSGENRVE